MTKDGLTHFSAHQRDQAMKKYVIIQPYLNNEKTMASIAWEAKVSERTLFYWLKKYKQGGLVGLIHQTLFLFFLQLLQLLPAHPLPNKTKKHTKIILKNI